MATLAEFASRMRQLADQASKGANKAKIAVAVAVDQAVVLATPVGDPNLWQHKAPPGYVGGRARANWVVSVGGAYTGTVDSTDWGSALSQGRSAAQGAKPGQAIHVTNNLPYIGALNEGHSHQAPAGFIQTAVQAGADEAGRVRVLEP